MEWIKLTDRMPNPDEHGRVLMADFISPRTRRLIQTYQDGDSVATTAAILLAEPPAQQHWD